METLPPKIEHKVVRTRVFHLGPDGLLALLRDLKRERMTGQITLNISQGSLGDAKVEDSERIVDVA